MGLPKPSRRRTRSLLAPPVRGRSPAASRLCPPHNWADRRSCSTPFIREVRLDPQRHLTELHLALHRSRPPCRGGGCLARPAEQSQHPSNQPRNYEEIFVDI